MLTVIPSVIMLYAVLTNFTATNFATKSVFNWVPRCRCRCKATPLMLTGGRLGFGCWLAVAGEFGKEAELEKLSSSSERIVETDLAEPELTEPVPERYRYLK
jgi:hypothetical protein